MSVNNIASWSTIVYETWYWKDHFRGSCFPR